MVVSHLGVEPVLHEKKLAGALRAAWIILSNKRYFYAKIYFCLIPGNSTDWPSAENNKRSILGTFYWFLLGILSVMNTLLVLL